MQCIIDRFEGEFAVVEYGDKTFDLPVAFLPRGAKEGDALEIAITVDPERTKSLREKADKLMEELWEK